MNNICVVGLGYVGLPLAIELAKNYNVAGYDIDSTRLDELKMHHDRTKEVTPKELMDAKLSFIADLGEVDADIYVVTVPTPIMLGNEPDLKPLKSACEKVGLNMKAGDIVVFESTVYPGCTRGFCVPILEKLSGLKFDEDFSVGYSPERINPGDKHNTIRSVKKLISASNSEALDVLNSVYGSVVDAGLHICRSIEIAEAAKILENTQRDVNIALMNEVSSLFDKLELPTLDVIEAAATKWNFLKFYPGLVGGHCISVDPYYLVHCADQNDMSLNIIKAARQTSENISSRIFERIKATFESHSSITSQSDFRVHLEGVTFKENCPDIRNSKIFDTIDSLIEEGFAVSIGDAWISENERTNLMERNYNFSIPDTVDLFVLVLGHDYMRTKDYLRYVGDKILERKGKIIDLKGMVREFDLLQEAVIWEL